MTNIERIQIHHSLTEALEKLRKEVAFDLKKKYNLNEIVVPRTLSSQILAAKMKGNKTVFFKIRKKGQNKGFLELL